MKVDHYQEVVKEIDAKRKNFQDKILSYLYLFTTFDVESRIFVGNRLLDPILSIQINIIYLRISINNFYRKYLRDFYLNY
jgi:hypothetical protein